MKRDMPSGQYRLCQGEPKNEDETCSNQLEHIKYNPLKLYLRHSRYYGRRVKTFGFAGCAESKKEREILLKRKMKREEPNNNGGEEDADAEVEEDENDEEMDFEQFEEQHNNNERSV